MNRTKRRRFTAAEKSTIRAWLESVLFGQEVAVSLYDSITGEAAKARIARVAAYYRANVGFVRHLLSVLEDGRPARRTAKGAGNGNR